MQRELIMEQSYFLRSVPIRSRCIPPIEILRLVCLQYEMDVAVLGASDVSLPSGELELCTDGGFFSLLMAVSVEVRA